MSAALNRLKNALKALPSLGAKSAENIALHLTIENTSLAKELNEAIKQALQNVSACPVCCGLSENDELCQICSDVQRTDSKICIVEKYSDISAIEKSGAWNGKYHVLGGKLSPIKKIGPDKLNLEKLQNRLESDNVSEVLLALSNDIEAMATCHYIQEKIISEKNIKLTRIGFGLPSGSQLSFADTLTIKSALEARQQF